MSPLLIRFVIERNGNGHTVVVVSAVLFAAFGSVKSLVTNAVLVMLPTAVGTTVNVTVAEPPLLMVPSNPKIGLAAVFNAPCVVELDWNETDGESVFVSLTFEADTGPIFVITIV